MAGKDSCPSLSEGQGECKRKKEIRPHERETRLWETLTKRNLPCALVRCVWATPACCLQKSPETSSRSESEAVFLLGFMVADGVASWATSHSSWSVLCGKWTLGGTKACRTELPRSGNKLATSCRSPSSRIPKADGARAVHTGRRTMNLITGQWIDREQPGEGTS